MRLISNTLVEQGVMPFVNTLSGGNVSPHLDWTPIPGVMIPDAKSFVMTCVDPDAPWGRSGLPGPGTFPADLIVHWMVYDIPGSVRSLAADASRNGLPGRSTRQLRNSCRHLVGTPFHGHQVGYFGSAPPQGDRAHRYIFTVYALGTPELGLSSDADYPDLLRAMQGYVLDVAQLTVYFGQR
ncbi:MAG: PBP family phospholipid-binding protein [Parcubacteria group bacterium GW2011_GWA1_47_11]|nr:MAG: PBP family phospholipid-binding protein [Parcubacteria group bacterium GW2011_GWA1_47_11]